MRYFWLFIFVFAEGRVHAEALQTRLNVPEPMVFDLVRPLGAERGELEVNMLFQHDLKKGGVPRWAPEVEYAFAEGYSIEFELPVKGARLYEYKAALQGTFGTLVGEQGIHGWQVIGRLGRGSADKSADALHLTAFRINQRWSIFNMAGYRHSYHEELARRAALLNPTIFYAFRRNMSLGLEHNFALGERHIREHLIMPQAQFSFVRGWILQLGLGVQGSGTTPTLPNAAFRLTRVLR